MTDQEIVERLDEIINKLDKAEEREDNIMYSEALLEAFDMKEELGQERVLDIFLEYLSNKNKPTLH